MKKQLVGVIELDKHYFVDKRFRWLFFSSIFIGMFFISWRLDSDAWFLLNSGRYVLAHGIPYIEPFTIHENLHFVMQQWLTSVVFWLIYHQLGMEYLFLLLYLVFMIMVIVLYRLCMLVSAGNFQVSVILTALTGILLTFFMVTRPQIFSALLILIAIYCMELYVQKKKMKYLLVLPLLSLLLINLHASLWPMIFVIMLPYFIDAFSFKYKFLEGEGYPKKGLVVVLILMILAGFMNPYGLDAMTYLFTSYGYDDVNATIIEMRPLMITDTTGKMWFCVIFVTMFTYLKKNIKLRYLLLSLGTAYMAMSSIRSLFIFFVCGLFPWCYAFKDSLIFKSNATQITLRVYRLRRNLTYLLGLSMMVIFYRIYEEFIEQVLMMPNWSIIFFSIVSVIFSVFLVYYIWREWTSKEQMSRQHCLQKIIGILLSVLLCTILTLQFLSFRNAAHEPLSKVAIDHMLAQSLAANIVLWTNYGNGQYAEFRGIKCYIDARADVFFLKNNKQKDIYSEYLKVDQGVIHYKEFIRQYSFTHFLTAKNDLFYIYLYHDPEYQLIFEDENYRLYEKVH